MKKIIAYSVLILSATILIICAVDHFTKTISNLRKTPEAFNSWWGSDRYEYGDLYGFTYLPQFRLAEPAGSDDIVPKWPCSIRSKSFNIYGLSDSYTFNVFKTPVSFCGADKIGFAASNFKDVLPFTMDHSKKNYLIIETVERNARALFADSAYLVRFIQPVNGNQPATDLNTAENRKKFRFNFNINRHEGNYEFNLWDYRLFTPLKEWKAKVNYEFFGRINPDAVVSPDGKFLLLHTTIDTAFKESSYKPIEDKEVQQIVANLNNAYAHYKQAGFDEIYLSIIPNPTTILYPRYHQFTYNNLITKVQKHPELKLRVFDCYGLFKSYVNKEELYRQSDTHWTSVGRDLWLKTFNKLLAKDIGRG
jgi:hypothetical protein